MQSTALHYTWRDLASKMRSVISRFPESSQTVSEFCKLHNLSVARYHYWRRRVDSGEYRIVYTSLDSDIRVVLVGKRNDDEVYKDMQRALT